MEKSSAIKNFEELLCWQKAREVRIFIMNLVNKFPGEERFSLKDNIKRAARSVTNNIAEGYGRFHFQENIQFCRISRGSLYETIDHLMIAHEEEYINASEFEQGKRLITDAITILNGYISYLARAKAKTPK